MIHKHLQVDPRPVIKRKDQEAGNNHKCTEYVAKLGEFSKQKSRSLFDHLPQEDHYLDSNRSRNFKNSYMTT